MVVDSMTISTWKTSDGLPREASKTREMSDFEMTQWVDFVRGLPPPTESENLQRHLDKDCRECAAVVQFLNKVVAATPRVTVPDELVQAALRVFPAHLRTAERPGDAEENR